jgi:hypothetical protein
MKRSKKCAGIVGRAMLVACLIIGIAVSTLDAATQFFSVNMPNMEMTIQYILDLINTESGATESKQSVNTTWTYSAGAAGPCVLHVREDLQRLSPPPDSTTPAVPVHETVHYLIPVADIDFGPFGTHHILDRHRVMHQTIFMNHGTIRRWTGDSPVMPQQASVEFAAPINFGKPYVNIFEAPIRLENALRHLAFICQTSSKPDNDPFRNGCGVAVLNCSR